jgi:predicted Zn-dependent protease
MKAVLYALFCAASVFAQYPEAAGATRDRNVYSKEKARALGQQLATEVEHQADVIDNPILVEYLERVGKWLSAECSVESPLQVRVIASDEMNAFALPGGFLFVNTGLIRNAGSEAELAGVLAHLIASVRTGPLMRSGNIGNYGSIPLIFMGGWHGYGYQPESAKFLLPVGLLKAHRAAVLANDEYGLQCLSQAGYDPEAFVQNLQRLQAAEPAAASTLAAAQFATHPLAGDRIAKAQAAIAEMPPRSEYRMSTSSFDEVKAWVERSYPMRPRRASPPSLLTPEERPPTKPE